MLKTFIYQKRSLISSHQCDENLTHMPAHIQIVDLKPHEFPGWNLKLPPMYEGQGDTRARCRALQVGGWVAIFFFLALEGKFLYIYIYFFMEAFNWRLYNIVVVFAIHSYESAMDVHVLLARELTYKACVEWPQDK